MSKNRKVFLSPLKSKGFKEEIVTKIGGIRPPQVHDPGIHSEPRQMVLLGMHKAPEFVQLTFNDMEVAPQVKHHKSAVLGRAIQPGTHGIFVDLDDACRRADRIAFR